MTFNILIVDDSYSMRMVIKKIITLSGFKMDQCFEACNGREALEVLAGQWVDVIISDINMPEMSGIEMLGQLKQDNLFKDIPVIMVSTEGNRERVEEACRLGASGFLKKPFVPEELRRVLQEVIGLSDDGSYGEEGQTEAPLDF